MPKIKALSARTIDWARIRRSTSREDIVHVHYGLFGYYQWGVENSVMHLHGSDVTSNLPSRILGPVVRRSIRNAKVVLYSTPNLEGTVRELRPDAIWLPNPVDLPSYSDDEPHRAEHGGVRVLFCSRWDSEKGTDKLLELTARLRLALPGVELVGLDWGSGRKAAAAAGVHLTPVMSKSSFHKWLRSSDLIVGQVGGGALGISDLEALSSGTPTVARFTYPDAYPTPPPLLNEAEDDLLELVLDGINNPQHSTLDARSARMSWVREFHEPSRVVDRLATIYSENFSPRTS